MTTSTETHPDYIVGTWAIDPSHSDVTFSVKHLLISKVKGNFSGFSGTVVTPEDPTNISITAEIDIATVNTGDANRDGHLKTGDFFLVEQYPTATFESASVVVTGADLTIEGFLTLRGVTKPVTLKGEVAGVVTDAYGQTKAAASVTTVINRNDFGVNWNTPLDKGGFTLGDDVTLTLEIQATLQK